MSSATTVTAVVAVLNSALSRLPAVITSVCEVRLVRVYGLSNPTVSRALYAEVVARRPHVNILCDVYLSNLDLLGTSIHSPLHGIDMWEAVQTFAKQHEILASRAVRIMPFI